MNHHGQGQALPRQSLFASHICLSIALFVVCVLAGAGASAQESKPNASKTTKKEAASKTAKSEPPGKAAKDKTAKDKAAKDKTGGEAAKAKTPEKSAKPATKANAGAASGKTAAGKPDANKAAGKADASKTTTAKTGADKAATSKVDSDKTAAASKASKDRPVRAKPKALGDDELKARLDTALKLTPAESVKELEAILKANPQSALRPRALELLTAARAALGDERLKAGDAERGIELFRLAVADAPAEIPDKLFTEVVSQLPANLYLRGQGAAALELARAVEERVKENPKRLLNLAAFYLNVEQPGDAARLAEAAIKLAPDMSVAYLALGAAQRIALKLDAAADAYKRALELDPKAPLARRSLADLQRANGKSAEALALYRELLAADPKDTGARTGAVLSMFDAGQREDAERELKAALQDEPQNLQLLVGAAWWYVARGEAERAQELATQAVQLEPRYTWAHIALARSLVAQKRPLDAERSLRFARQYGRFPTLDYELANTLAASGLYEEAAEELEHSFRIADGQLETQLAGRTPARADNFTDLLALERRASIFQYAAADTDANARMLKSLLVFHLLMKNAVGATVYGTDAGAAEARAFVEGQDEMRAFRQLYAASRLLKAGASLGEVLKLTDEAAGQVDTALNSPSAQAALLADELRDVRARALAGGNLPGLPDVPRNVLSNVMRGRIEDMAGWSLFIEGKPADAVVRLRRAASVLPENSLWWRNALWHLGAALDATGNQKDALASYLKSYNRQSPDLARRAIIEGLYKRVNGSLEGLDDKVGPAPAALSNVVAPVETTTTTSETPKTDAPTSLDPARNNVATPSKNNETIVVPSSIAPTPEVKTDAEPKPEATRETKTEVKPEQPPASKPETPPATPRETPPPEPTPTPAPSSPTPPIKQQPTETSNATPAPEQSAALTPQPSPTPTAANTDSTAKPTTDTEQSTAPTPTPTPDASPTPAPKSETESKPETRSGNDAGACSLSLSEDSLAIPHGGSATLTVSYEGASGASSVKATTANWSDIIVLAEPRANGDASVKFTITSIGQKPGSYTVTFKAPCGSKKVTVTVK